jgi:hypothetical protein
MAAHQTTRNSLMGGEDDEMSYLWSFDLWHESLYQDACKQNMCIAQAG